MKINKTDTGYTLRQSPFPAAVGGALLGMGLSFAAITVLMFSAANSKKELGGLVFLAVGMCVIMGVGIYQLATNVGRRLILDRNGVHLKRSLLKERFLPWEKVRDLGFTHVDGTGRQRSRRVHYFYISPTRLGSDGSIRVIRNQKLVLHLTVSRDEIVELYGRGVIDFCEKQANEGREEWDRVVPYSSLETIRRP